MESPRKTIGCLHVKTAAVLFSLPQLVIACVSIVVTFYHLVSSRAAFGIFDAFVLVIQVAQAMAFGFTFGRIVGAIRSTSANRLNKVFVVQGICLTLFALGWLLSIYNAIVPLGNEDAYLLDLVSTYVPLKHIKIISKTALLRIVAWLPIIFFALCIVYTVMSLYVFNVLRKYLRAKQRAARANDAVYNAEMAALLHKRQKREEDAHSGGCACC